MGQKFCQFWLLFRYIKETWTTLISSDNLWKAANHTSDWIVFFKDNLEVDFVKLRHGGFVCFVMDKSDILADVGESVWLIPKISANLKH